jgi:hypothetical protein
LPVQLLATILRAVLSPAQSAIVADHASVGEASGEADFLTHLPDHTDTQSQPLHQPWIVVE